MPATDTLGKPGPETGSRFTVRPPDTPLGRFSVLLGATFIVLFGVNSIFVGIFGRTRSVVLSAFSRTFLPYFGVGLMAIGFAAGVVGLVAVLWQKERSILTLLTAVPMLFVVVFVLAEFLLPH